MGNPPCWSLSYPTSGPAAFIREANLAKIFSPFSISKCAYLVSDLSDRGTQRAIPGRCIRVGTTGTDDISTTPADLAWILKGETRARLIKL